MPPALEELIDRALAKHPADRPGSARELEISLRGLLNDLKGPRPTTTVTGSTAPAGASSAWGAGAAAPAAEEKAFGGAVEITLADGTVVSKDDGPRPGTTLEGISGLKPVFRPDGTITAGDVVVIREQDTAENGDIVVALVEGAETVIATLGTPNNAAVTVTDPEGTGTINDATALTVAIGRMDEEARRRWFEIAAPG